MAEEKTDLHEKNIVTLEDSGPCKKKVLIEVPEETIKAALDEQFKDLRRDAEVPGFRKGRAPMRLIEKRFGTDVNQQVKLKLLADASEAAIKGNDIDMLGDPDIDYEKIELPETGSLKFDFEVEVRPDFDLPELEGIAVDKQKVEADAAEIDKELDEMRKRAGIWQPKEDGVVEEGDQLLVDALLTVEGAEEVEKRDNIEVFARKNAFVSGIPVENLDEVLAGAKHGDKKTTSVEVPKTFHNEDYRGKKIDMEIEVKEVKQMVPAELNEEFFKRFGVEDADELKERITEVRQQQAEQQARTAMGDQVYKYLLDSVTFDLPESIVADQATRIMQRQYSSMLMQNMPKEQLAEQMQQLQASSDDQAKEQMRLFFIMDKIAEKMGIEVSEEELNGHIAQAAMQRGRRPEKMREEMLRDGSLAQFSLQVREQKCIEKLLETAKITEVDAPKEKKAAPKKTAKKKTAKKKTTKKADAETTEEAPKKATKKAVKKTAKKTTKKEE